jgi:hypothetical protein
MTVYCPAISPSPFWQVAVQAETGSSSEAEQVRQKLGESLDHYLAPRLEQVVFPIIEVFVRSAAEPIPVAFDTVNASIAFARLLPRIVPIPEVSADPDGEISFDWVAASGKMFSVSVSGSGRLSYAGFFGENARVHGTEELVDGLPEEILRGIQKASR